MHSLNGVAGNLSATDVYRLASELEELLKGPASTAEVPLVAALERACDVIAHSVARLGPAEPEAVPAALGGNYPSSIPLIRELRRLVTRDDPRAIDVMKQLKGNAGLAEAAGSHLAALEANLAVFDFEQAALIVGDLAADLGEAGKEDGNG
jgi:HPt (histidine-containing phosphotransfer) domain-containing protein